MPRFRYGAWHGGSDPLEPPVDLRSALDQIGRDVLEGASPRSALEELLRFDTPLPLFERYVLEDLTLHGEALRPGEKVGLLYASGNRDPRRFERPDTLDLTRDPNPHLTFGLGTHYCLGAPLARLELALSLRALARTFPGLRLADPDAEPEYVGGFVIRGLRRLDVVPG